MNDASRDHLDRHVAVRLARISETKMPPETALSREDQERVARFRFPEDRARFALGRALLGQCLTHYFGTAIPLELAYTPQGRPFLPHDPEIQFSISHTHDLVGVALSLRTLVGIDLEYIQPGFDPHDLAERIFSEEDLKSFLSLSAEERPRAFFRAWTGKEACLKAQGVGISGGIKEVSVPLQRADAPCPITGLLGGEDARPWRLQALPVPADYAGTVAWNDPQKRLDFLD